MSCKQPSNSSYPGLKPWAKRIKGIRPKTCLMIMIVHKCYGIVIYVTRRLMRLKALLRPLI